MHGDLARDDNWARELRGSGRGAAVEELRAYVRRGLATALRGRVDSADLEDFTQDALVRVLESLHTFRGESRFTTWAMAVAIRVSFSTLRRRRPTLVDNRNGDLLEALEGEAPSDADPSVRADHRARLRRLVEAIRHELTPRQRKAVLDELRGVPSEELAAELGITRNALYKLHHDARKKLRRAVDGPIATNGSAPD